MIILLLSMETISLSTNFSTKSRYLNHSKINKKEDDHCDHPL